MTHGNSSNPATSEFTIEYSFNEASKTNMLEVVNLLGNQQMVHRFNGLNGRETINVSGLVSGIFIVNIVSDGVTVKKVKVVVQH